MLTFFRRIRKGLLSEGATSKYLLYAIGEIALVVIGILIALQINNWNEWRKERIKETEIINGLVENLELNIQTLKTDIDFLRICDNSSRIVLNVLDNRLPFVDSLDRHFHFSRIPKNTLSLSQSGYEQFKNTGYDIILNKRLKKEVISFFESTLPKWYGVYNVVNASHVPFIDHHVPLFTYHTEKLVPINMNFLYEDHYYLGWMRAYLEGRKTLIKMEMEFIEENQRVLQLIKDELSQTK